MQLIIGGLTASRLPLAAECCWWLRPGVHWTEDPPGPAAERGSRIHASIAHRLGYAPPAPALDAGERRAVRRALAVVRILGSKLAGVEQKLSFDPALCRGRWIDRPGARDYGPLAPGEVAATIDAYLRPQRRTAVLLEWKSGHGPLDWYTPQVAGQAVGLLLAEPTVDAVLGILVGLDGPPQFHAVPVERAEVAALCALFTRWLAEAAQGTAEPQRNDHCGWCPARGSCPAYQATLAPVVARTLPAITDAATAVAAHHTLSVAYAELGRYNEELKSYLRQTGPVHTPAGVLELVERQRTSVSLAAVPRTLVQPLQAAGAITTTTYEQRHWRKATP